MVTPDRCREYRDGIEKRINNVETANQNANTDRAEINKRINTIKDNSATSVDNIMKKVSKKAEEIHLDLTAKFKDVTGGVSMKLFLWVSGGLVCGLCLSIGYLYAMNGNMGEYKNEINNTVNSLATDTKLIQKDMEYTRNDLKNTVNKIEKLMNNKP